MAYTSGDTILDDEYNGFLTNTNSPYGINHIMGTGSGQYGLGLSTLSTVAAGNTITAAQWNSLFSAMNNIANHANVTLTSTTNKAAGDPIAIISALQTDLNNLASAVANGCPSATALSTSSNLLTSSSATRWINNHTVEHRVDFANANAMRYFFNAGGKVLAHSARTGGGNSNGSATSKDNSMTQVINAVGTVSIGAVSSTRSGSGETLSTNGLANGFYDLGTGYTTILQVNQNGSGYTNMYIRVQAKLNAAPGSATQMTVRTQLVDGDGGDGTYQSSNTSGVNIYANYLGRTQVYLRTVTPTTAQGLASTYGSSGQTVVSNTSS